MPPLSQHALVGSDWLQLTLCTFILQKQSITYIFWFMAVLPSGTWLHDSLLYYVTSLSSWRLCSSSSSMWQRQQLQVRPCNRRGKDCVSTMAKQLILSLSKHAFTGKQELILFVYDKGGLANFRALWEKGLWLLLRMKH